MVEARSGPCDGEVLRAGIKLHQEEASRLQNLESRHLPLDAALGLGTCFTPTDVGVPIFKRLHLAGTWQLVREEFSHKVPAHEGAAAQIPS